MTISADRKVLITGGASGFGLDIARRLLAVGAQVAILDKSEKHLQSAIAELGGGCLPIVADVSIPTTVSAAARTVNATFGGLDTVVISAGVLHIKPLAEVSEADWDVTLDVNLKGAFFTIQAASQFLIDSGRGRIVAISSDAGRRGFSQIQAYCASKFGLIGLVESCAVELAPSQVTVNCVCPVGCPTTAMGQAVVDWKTQMGQSTPEKILQATARTNPLGRNATESDITEAVAFFLSDEASFLTGCSLDVDGGAHLGFFPGAS